MTYKDKFVAIIKCNNQILREKNGAFYLPFGSEYSILLKNLESRKALVGVEIDGEDVVGGKLIINPNDDFELERFIKGNLHNGYRFKFIQKIKEIVEHRGDKIADGIVRVEFAFEKMEDEHIHHYHHHHDYYDWYHWYYPRPWVPYKITWSSSCDNTSNYTNSLGISPSSKGLTGSISCSHNLSVPEKDEGITVEGSDSNQRFCRGSIGIVEQSHVIVLRLKGYHDEVKVENPITVKTRFTCKTCGKVSKSANSFCGRCGTRLVP